MKKGDIYFCLRFKCKNCPKQKKCDKETKQEKQTRKNRR